MLLINEVYNVKKIKAKKIHLLKGVPLFIANHLIFNKGYSFNIFLEIMKKNKFLESHLKFCIY